MARRPGALAQALTRPTAYRARQTDIWDQVTDRLAGCLTARDVDEFLVWVDFHELAIPEQWSDEIDALVERRREELAAEDIGQILLERFDFT
jgi:hypothetical protein